MASKIIVNEIENQAGTATPVTIANINTTVGAITTATITTGTITAGTITTLNTTDISTGTLAAAIVFPAGHIIRNDFTVMATTSTAVTSATTTDLIISTIQVDSTNDFILATFNFSAALTGASTGFWEIYDKTGSALKASTYVTGTDQTMPGMVRAYFNPVSTGAYQIKTRETWGSGTTQTLGDSSGATYVNSTTLLLQVIKG